MVWIWFTTLARQSILLAPFVAENILLIGNHSASDEQPLSNADFSSAFTYAFFDFVVFLNESEKLDPSSITPQWPQWNEGQTEMLFNLTASSMPVVHTITTDRGLLKRCELVL